MPNILCPPILPNILCPPPDSSEVWLSLSLTLTPLQPTVLHRTDPPALFAISLHATSSCKKVAELKVFKKLKKTKNMLKSQMKLMGDLNESIHIT